MDKRPARGPCRSIRARQGPAQLGDGCERSGRGKRLFARGRARATGDVALRTVPHRAGVPARAACDSTFSGSLKGINISAQGKRRSRTATEAPPWVNGPLRPQPCKGEIETRAETTRIVLRLVRSAPPTLGACP